MTLSAPQLAVVMPVYNEQASVRKVVREWFEEIQNWTEDFVFLALDDGSKDDTLGILRTLQDQLGPRLEVRTRENRSHGQTCLEGYRIVCERGIPWVLQLDSDGQCDPQYFFRFWRLRENSDVVYGVRRHRDDGFRRVIASQLLRLTLLVFGRVWCVDANVPYRLMKTDGLAAILERIPRDFFLANVALAVLLRREGWREAHVPIRFRERYGGEPSVRLRKFGQKAVELIKQLQTLN